ncbi:MAG: glycosyltransferase family 39 protein, partial [Acidobacteria bacterium]|nr:glycosyltransferase family 39 protein [Acidobacteriota bacterium]MDW7985019.1 hypothetical protein [Acidobacteriota bacterium]
GELLFFLALAVYLWLRGVERPRFWFGAGLATALAYMTKSLTHPFTLALLLASLDVAVERASGSLRRAWHRYRWLLGGLGLGFLGWGLFVFWPHRDVFSMFFGWDWDLRRPRSWLDVLRHLWTEPGASYMLRYMPVLTMVGALQVLMVPVRRLGGRPTTPLERIAWLWFIAEFSTYSLLYYRYLRFWLPAFLAMFFLALAGLYRIVHGSFGPIGSWRWAPWYFLWWGAVIKTALNSGVFYILRERWPSLLDYDTRPFPQNYYGAYRTLALLAALATVGTLLGIRLARRWKGRGVSLPGPSDPTTASMKASAGHGSEASRPRLWVIAWVAALIGTEVLAQAAWAVHWWRYGPSTRLRDFSRFLADYLPAGSVLTGNFSPTLALETPFRAHPIYEPRKLNWESGILDRLGITHFVLVDFPDDRDQLLGNLAYLSTRPDEPERARFLLFFPLRNRRVELWSRFPPPMPGLWTRRTETHPDGTVSVVIENTDPLWSHEWQLPRGARHRFEPGRVETVRLRPDEAPIPPGQPLPSVDTVVEFERCPREGGLPVWDPQASQAVAVRSWTRVGQALCVWTINLPAGRWHLRLRVRNETDRILDLLGWVLDGTGRLRVRRTFRVEPSSYYRIYDWTEASSEAGPYTFLWINPGSGLRLDAWQVWPSPP